MSDKDLDRRPASGPTPTPTRQSYVMWLIECHTLQGAKWLLSTLGPPEWTTDANAAVKFETEEDAHHEIRSRGGPLAFTPGGCFAFPTDHMWILTSPHTVAHVPPSSSLGAATAPTCPKCGSALTQAKSDIYRGLWACNAFCGYIPTRSLCDAPEDATPDMTAEELARISRWATQYPVSALVAGTPKLLTEVATLRARVSQLEATVAELQMQKEHEGETMNPLTAFAGSTARTDTQGGEHDERTS